MSKQFTKKDDVQFFLPMVSSNNTHHQLIVNSRRGSCHVTALAKLRY